MCECVMCVCVNSPPSLRMVVCSVFTEEPIPIRICVRRVSIRQAIRRPTHEMIRRSVPVRAVKTRWWFGPKIVSFHVSVYFCIIVNYRYLLFNYYHVQILVVHINYCSWSCSLRWNLTRVVVFETEMYSIYYQLDI